MTEFLKEVDEQPRALLDLVSFYREQGAGLLERWNEMMEKYSSLTFIGMGTSELVSLLVQDALYARGRTVNIYDAGEYIHYLLPSSRAESLYVMVSQSGESVETRKATEALAGKAPVVVIANADKSTMARLADLYLPMKAGAERSVSNKTYQNSLALLYLMAGGKPDRLEELASYLADSLVEGEVIRAAQFLQPADSIHFIARGPALAAAHQMALTFMEGAKTHGRAFAAGSFRHGPFEVLGEKHRAVCLAPEGKTGELCLAMAREMASKGSRVVLLTDMARIPEHENLLAIQVKAFGEERLFPLTLTVIQGYLLHHVARLRGYEAGVFDVASKVTTVE